MRLAALFTLLFLTVTARAEIGVWPGYPDSLTDYTYEGDDLQTHWEDLTALIHIAYPDEAYIRNLFGQYPDLKAAMLREAAEARAHPALKAIMKDDYSALAIQLQNVWRLHYSGRYQQAYDLGMQLGPVGEIPANYARLINASFIITDKKVKLAEFRACEESSQSTLKLAPDYALNQYGLVYARVRILELLDNTQARNSGYIDYAQSALQKLMKRFPDEPVYPVTEGGLEAGIVARVGSLLATLTYGVSEDSAISAFNRALRYPKARQPTVLNEFATAMTRISVRNYGDDIRRLHTLCAQADVKSAEEALVQAQCRAELSR